MPKNMRKRGGVWWYRITRHGVTHEGSLETGVPRIAQERLESIRRELTATRFVISISAASQMQISRSYDLRRLRAFDFIRRFGFVCFDMLTE